MTGAHSNPGTVDSWRRNKLAVCLACRQTLRHPHASGNARAVARERLRIVQEHFLRLRLARRLAGFLRPVNSGDSGERRPFLVEDHNRIFDGLEEARASMELGLARLVKLRKA